MISMLRYELAQYSQVTLMDGTPQKDDALLRIIHYPLFYGDHPEDDEYLRSRQDLCANLFAGSG